MEKVLASNHIISSFVAACEQSTDCNIKTMMLAVDGNVRLEYHVEPYDLDTPQLLFSITKSITALAIGIASDLSLLSLDDRVAIFLKKSCQVLWTLT